MKITYNNPERFKERENVVPPTMEEMQNIALSLELGTHKGELYFRKDLQRLLDHYSNLQHFYDVVGGWDKYSEVINHYGALHDFITNLHESNVIQQRVEDILK